MLLSASACGRPPQGDGAIVKQGGFTRAPFGQAAGAPVYLYTLTNTHGMEVRAMSYGATIVSLRVPDRGGASDDVVLGFDALDGYLAREPYFGAIVGRYGNRIAKGRFTLDGDDVSAGDQQRPEPPARRREGIRQGRVEGGAVRPRRPVRRRLHASSAPTATKAIPATSTPASPTR